MHGTKASGHRTNLFFSLNQGRYEIMYFFSVRLKQEEESTKKWKDKAEYCSER